MTDDLETAPPLRLLIGLFAAIAALMVADLADDARKTIDLLHLLLESAVLALAAAGVAMLWRESSRARHDARRLGADLHSARADAVRWREEADAALQGFGAAIQRQFARWDLTAAEGAVALLLLQGLSHKEVAQARETSERTVRQQALAVYRKAGLHSRAELAAFFLGDLVLPAITTREPPAAPAW